MWRLNLFGVTGSLLVNVLLGLAFHHSILSAQLCFWNDEPCTRFGPGPEREPYHPWPPFIVEQLWGPYIDNVQEPGQWRKPRCATAAAVAGDARLLYAPLSERYTSSQYFPLFACVYVGRDGEVRISYLSQNQLGPADRASVLRQINGRWVFKPAFRDGRPVASWQRVRLSRFPKTEVFE